MDRKHKDSCNCQCYFPPFRGRIPCQKCYPVKKCECKCGCTHETAEDHYCSNCFDYCASALHPEIKNKTAEEILNELKTLPFYATKDGNFLRAQDVFSLIKKYI